MQPISVAVRRSKAQVCGLPIAGITRSNSVEIMDVRFLVFIVCCVCQELITRSEDSCRVFVYVCLCVCLDVCDIGT